MAKIRWIASAGNEGAPFLIADVNTLAAWDGEDEEDVDVEVGEATITTTGSGHPVLYWDMYGAGTADIGMVGDSDEIVLLRSWVDEEEDHEALKRRVADPVDGETDCGELLLEGDIVVVSWSPVPGDEIAEETVDDEPLAQGLRDRLANAEFVELDSEGIDGIGVAFIARPGRYRVTWFCKPDMDDELSYCLCRLKRT